MTRSRMGATALAACVMASVGLGCGSSSSDDEGPEIQSFDASPQIIGPGSSSILSWSAPGAERVSLDHGLGVLTGSSVLVSPTTTTTYTLTAVANGKTVSASVTVTVAAPPVIAHFAAAPGTVPRGGSSVLWWSVTGATAFVLDNGIGPVTGESITVTPASTTTYTLTATGSMGTTSRQVTVTVVENDQPRIVSFASTPVTIVSGASSVLSWSCFGADTLSIDQGVGPVSGTSVSVHPAQTTTYTLTASRGSISVSASATVIVAPLPVIAVFTASPASVAVGGSSTLSWSVSGADVISIDQGIGVVSGQTGTIQVRPWASTTYTLHASNSGGSTTAQVTVALREPANYPRIDSFSANPTTVTRGQSTTLTWSVFGADTLTLDNGIGVATGTSRAVTPSSTTTYTLTATNSAGSTTAVILVTVQVPPEPPTTAVGDRPFDVLFDGTSVWVENSGSDTVTRIRPSDGAVLGTYGVGDEPRGTMAYDGAHLWVTCTNGGTVAKVRVSDGVTIATYSVAGTPHGAVFDGEHVWVALYGANAVAKLRAADGAVLGTYETGRNPNGVAFDGSTIWVSTLDGITRLRASDGAALGSFSSVDDPYGVLFDGASIWFANHAGSSVTKVRPSDGAHLGTFTVGARPLYLTTNGTDIWVTNNGDGSVTRLRAENGATVSTTRLGSSPYGIAFDGTHVWVADYESDTVSRLP